jgi:hypothetical protein
VGGEYISLQIVNFPYVLSGQYVTAIFKINGNQVNSKEVVVIYSTSQETSLTIVTPYIDLGQDAISATVPVTIFAIADTNKYVNFNYTFHSVYPSVESFSPAFGKENGGDVVWVKIKYFQYPSRNVSVRVGDIYAETRISAVSNPGATLISFVTPGGLPVGFVQIRISPQTCNESCTGQVSFPFEIKPQIAYC